MRDSYGSAFAMGSVRRTRTDFDHGHPAEQEARIHGRKRARREAGGTAA
ncbi:MAG: hypothetical protein IPM60_01810 [Rhodospirillales bacterium]|nr:hypothetical protein [Rhodospirillales bacterium]